MVFKIFHYNKGIDVVWLDSDIDYVILWYVIKEKCARRL